MKRITFAITGCVLVLFAASSLKAQTLPDGITNTMVQEGQVLYVGTGLCAVCHRPGGAGAIGPSLLDDEWLVGDGEYEQIVNQIMEGVAPENAQNAFGAFMPPKGGSTITDEQVRSVAAYVWTLSNGGS